MKMPEFQNDHDALIFLIAEVGQIKEAIKELKDGTSDRIKDHEVRINTLEEKADGVKLYVRMTMWVGAIVIGLLIWHLTGYSI